MATDSEALRALADAAQGDADAHRSDAEANLAMAALAENRAALLRRSAAALEAGPPLEPPGGGDTPPTDSPGGGDPPPAAEPGKSRILRILRLGQQGPWMSCLAPTRRQEESTYNRDDELGWSARRDVSFVWTFVQQAVLPAAAPRCRLMTEDGPASDWTAPDDKGRYSFPVTLADGEHIIYTECEHFEVVSIAVPYIVNGTGAAFDRPGRAWTATKRFELGYDNGGLLKIANVAVLVERGDAPPVTLPFKPREIVKFNTLLPKSEMWVRHWHDHWGHELLGTWRKTPLGDWVIEREQKYFHSTAVWKLPDYTGQDIRQWDMLDGPRGQSSLMYVADIRIRTGPAELAPMYGYGAYFLETNGRLGLLTENGRVINELGLGQAHGALHGGVKSGVYAGADADDSQDADAIADAAAFDAQFVEVADWSQVQGPHGLWEPWGFEVLYRDADGQIHDRDGHEFWVADTLHHRIIFANHWTAHSAARYEPAHVPPRGYVSPPEPTGKTEVFNFVGSLDGKPTEHCNEPWHVKWRKQDNKFYWTNHAGNSIARCDIDGSNPEIVLLSSLHPTPVELGMPHLLVKRVPTPQRATQGDIDPKDLRQLWVRDGPLGEASCVRPTAFDFDSMGNLVWIEHYTYAIRRLDIEAGTVATLNYLLDVNGGSESSGNNEPTLVIDDEGTFGPQDDIFCWAWGSATDKRYSGDGTWRAKPWRGLFEEGHPATNGPMEHVVGPNYGWGLDVGGGRLLAVGSAAGSQMWEVTRRLPTDPDLDLARFERGMEAWRRAGVPQIVLGPGGGQGQLGLPTCDEMSGMTDEALSAYLTACSVSEASIADCTYFVRWGSADRAHPAG